VTDAYTITYTYYGMEGLKKTGWGGRWWGPEVFGERGGLLKSVTDPTATTTSTDAFGSVTVSASVQDYEVHLGTGQAN